MPQTAFFIHWLSQTQWNMKVFTSTLNCIRSKYLTDVSQTELAFKLFKSMLPALCKGWRKLFYFILFLFENSFILLGNSFILEY